MAKQGLGAGPSDAAPPPRLFSLWLSVGLQMLGRAKPKPLLETVRGPRCIFGSPMPDPPLELHSNARATLESGTSGERRWTEKKVEVVFVPWLA